jgi:hypothetical protein
LAGWENDAELAPFDTSGAKRAVEIADSTRLVPNVPYFLGDQLVSNRLSRNT